MIVLRKYANRKIYDSRTSRYLSTEDLLNILKEGEDIKVISDVSSDDITQVVLARIIYINSSKTKKDNKGFNRFKHNFECDLKDIIRKHLC